MEAASFLKLTEMFIFSMVHLSHPLITHPSNKHVLSTCNVQDIVLGLGNNSQ